jgi:V-type H+-transporting ATPase proteolipid subunit
MITASDIQCPAYAPIFGFIGVASCVTLSNFGSAWGTWKAGQGLCAMGTIYPAGVLKNLVPIVMAGVLGIYGLIVSVLLAQSISPPAAGDKYSNPTKYSAYNGYAHLAAGLCCGISCLAAGGCIGMIGDVGTQGFGMRATAGLKRAWTSGEGVSSTDSSRAGEASAAEGAVTAESANKLYVGMLIMLIFSEALALYGMIVALILSQHSYVCTAK